MENEGHEKQIQEIIPYMESKSTKDLLSIWKTNDRNVWMDEAFEAIRQVLANREVEIPEQEAEKRRTIEEQLEPDLFRSQLRLWSIGVLLVGVTYLGLYFVDKSFNPVIGALILVSGLLNFFLFMPGIYLINGAVLWLAALASIFTGQAVQTYTFIIIVQVIYGFLEVNKFLYITTVRPKSSDWFKVIGQVESEEDEEPSDEDVQAYVQVLVKKLGRKREWIDWMGRQAAANELGSLGADAVDAVSALELAMEDEKPEVRQAAEAALKLILPAEEQPAVDSEEKENYTGEK